MTCGGAVEISLFVFTCVQRSTTGFPGRFQKGTSPSIRRNSLVLTFEATAFVLQEVALPYRLPGHTSLVSTRLSVYSVGC